MNYTDKQLKAALAKMLPETVCYEQESLYWQYEEIRYDRPVMNRGNRILDTELLHLCWLVEETLTNLQKQKYGELLQDSMNEAVVGYVQDYHRNLRGLANVAHATWQNRVIALAIVKGIEI